jgi:hypothetical protein
MAPYITNYMPVVSALPRQKLWVDEEKFLQLLWALGRIS